MSNIHGFTLIKNGVNISHFVLSVLAKCARCSIIFTVVQFVFIFFMPQVLDATSLEPPCTAGCGTIPTAAILPPPPSFLAPYPSPPVQTVPLVPGDFLVSYKVIVSLSSPFGFLAPYSSPLIPGDILLFTRCFEEIISIGLPPLPF